MPLATAGNCYKSDSEYSSDFSNPYYLRRFHRRALLHQFLTPQFISLRFLRYINPLSQPGVRDIQLVNHNEYFVHVFTGGTSVAGTALVWYQGKIEEEW